MRWETDAVGSATVMARLADAGTTMIIRDWAEGDDGTSSGWIAAMRHPGLAQALVAIHARPGEKWSIGRLAEVAAMSRSSFSEKFARVVGISAAAYLAEWRMELARRILADRGRSIAEMAMEVGYTSEASFSRAYKRLVGTLPGSARGKPL